jgi:hypothetical protein
LAARRPCYNSPMANEIFEKRMNFIVEQQAKFAVDIQRLQEAQERTDGMLRRLIDVNLSLADHVGANKERIDKFEERMAVLDEKLRNLAEFQAHSDRRLDALIDVVDKLVRRNGGSA